MRSLAVPRSRDSMPLSRKTPLRRRPAASTSGDDAARLLWFLLRDRRIALRFARRHVIGPYVADFFCPAAGLAILLDDADDAARSRFFALRGVRLLRLARADLRRDPNRALQTILHAAAENLLAARRDASAQDA